MFLKIDLLKKFFNVHIHTPAFEFLINKGLQLYEKQTPTEMFSFEYFEIIKSTFFSEHLWWLLLKLIKN